MTNRLNYLLSALYSKPILAKELRLLLGGISPATLSRLTRQAGVKIVVFGKARATTYSRPRDLSSIGHIHPVYRIDMDGNLFKIGKLWSIYGGYWWDGELWESRYYSSLPWFIQDLRPEGFMGRAFSHKYATELGVPERCNSWNDDHTLIALSRRGEECIGDILIGNESLSRYMATTAARTVFPVASYPQFAEDALAGEPAGSSAGGEQPKFTVLIEQNLDHKNVLVKFSPLLTSNIGQRWSDLLVCEHIALTIINELGIIASKSEVYIMENRTFLEVERFDRVGDLGRLPVYSLTVVDAEFVGEGLSWTSAGDKLLQAKTISVDTYSKLVMLDQFGALIGNTDRHHGNVSFVPLNDARTFFQLAPVYDMLPMFYRPKDGEELLYKPYQSYFAVNNDAVIQCALKFWALVGEDCRISQKFKTLCFLNYEALKKMSNGPKLFG